MKQVLRIQDLKRRIEYVSNDRERIFLHLELAYELRNQDVEAAYRFLDDIQSLVEARNNELFVAEYSYTRGAVSACNFEYDVSLQSLFTALELFRKNGHIEGETRSLRWIAITYRNIGMLMTSLEYAHQAYAIAQDHDLKSLLGYCATIVGDCYVLLQRYDEGGKYHNQSAHIAVEPCTNVRANRAVQ
jgi:tetratricopeptide (TPR) repeat protein